MEKQARRLDCTTLWQCICVALLLFTGAQAWSAASAEWAPPPPAPDKYDWVQLTSGEWLKGEIKVIYQDSLEFDSDKLGLQKFDLADVKTIRSAQVVNVRLVGDQVATGKLLLEDGQIKVLGKTPQVFAVASAHNAQSADTPAEALRSSCA